MKTINNKKYTKIRALLKSSNREDATIGLILAAKAFNIKELEYNFPNKTDSKRAFKASLNYTNLVWGSMSGHIFCVSDWVFTFKEEHIQSWRRSFGDKEIKL